MAASRIKTIETVEQLPEIDRLEGMFHPRENPILLGHKHAESILLQALEARKLPHAWLLSGPEGIGKATLAYRFARYIFSYPNGRNGIDDSLEISKETKIFKQVAALSHPDLLVIRRAWDTRRKKFPEAIPVDEVRRLRSFLSTTRERDSWRVIIVDRADELNASSSNALLKSLEEPPQNSIFFLVASMTGKLPATIHSRCRRLELNSLSREDLVDTIQKLLKLRSSDGFDYNKSDFAEPSSADMQLICEISGGSVGRAIQFMNAGALGIYQKLISILEDYPEMNKSKIIDLSEKLAATNSARQFELFFALLLDIIHRSIRHIAGIPLEIEREKKFSEKICHVGSLEVWAELWEILSRRKMEVVALNLDRRNFILETFHRLEQVA